MKLKRVVISGFRGAPLPVELRLVEKSLCLLGENGQGKTTIVDSLEFWSSGDVSHYHREGYDLGCVVNVDSAAATVTCETTTHHPLTRTFTGGRVSELEASGPVAVGAALPPPLPILRHRTMAHFMDMSPGDKRKTLLELVGLSPLTEFRSALKTASNAADGEAREAERQLHAEVRAMETLTANREVVELAEELRTEANLARPITSEADLLESELEPAPSPVEPDRLGLIGELVRAFDQAGDDVSTGWNAAVANRELLAARSLSALVVAGEQVLAHWEDATCPLCRQPKDRDELSQELQQRAIELREADEHFTVLEKQLDDYRSRVELLVSVLDRLIAAAPPGGWPSAARLDAARERLREHQSILMASRRDRKPCPPAPSLDLPDLATLEAAAEEAVSDARAPRALAKLVQLQEQVRRLRDAERRAAAASSVSRGASAVLETTDTEVRRAIEEVIKQVGQVAADFYGRLASTPVYSDVSLEYRTERAGGIEFSLVFDGRHRVSPPQRIMSESQLNALGLALFLARLRVAQQPWRSLVLDDVVNSYDANHRSGLARLLSEEFADWQIVLFTHDRVFAALARRLLPGWRFTEVAAWTPAGGPVLVDGQSREQLRARLAQGRSANELGGLARVALEQGLSLPLEKLGLEIRYDPLGRYSAYELLQALRRGLRDRGSALADVAVLGRMEADSYLVNLSAHDRPADPALSTDDLRRLVDDLAELEQAFVCTACGDPAWVASRERGRHHQCDCSALAV